MKLALALSVVLMMSGTALAIKCYVCIACSTPTGLTDCGSATQCLRVEANGVVGRSCGTTGAANKCDKLSVLGISTETCICTGEACNGAGGLKAGTMIATLVAVFLAKMLM